MKLTGSGNRLHKATGAPGCLRVRSTKWLDRAQIPSDANGSQSFEALVNRAQGGTSVAKLFSPAVAWHWILSELTSRCVCTALLHLVFSGIPKPAGTTPPD